MKHVKTLAGASFKKNLKHMGCGEYQTSCQSACKTSCNVATRHAAIRASKGLTKWH